MIVADTHALLWWILSPQDLSRPARRALDDSAIAVAAITCFEIARLVHRGRVTLDLPVVEWLHNVFALPKVAFLPLTIEVTATAASLPDPIRDPVDRLIVATALHQGVPLVTKDHKIIAAEVVRTIW